MQRNKKERRKLEELNKHRAHDEKQDSVPRAITNIIIKCSVISPLKALASLSILWEQFIPANERGKAA